MDACVSSSVPLRLAKNTEVEAVLALEKDANEVAVSILALALVMVPAMWFITKSRQIGIQRRE
jgi:hypothetical protein